MMTLRCALLVSGERCSSLFMSNLIAVYPVSSLDCVEGGPGEAYTAHRVFRVHDR